MTEPRLSDIGLVVSEAVTDAVIHACRQRGPGRARYASTLGPTTSSSWFRTRGAGMAPRTDSPGLGFGPPLMARISQRFEIRAHEGGGTRLCTVRVNLLRGTGCA
jgi:serine/threonine-protein kinase RsbW